MGAIKGSIKPNMWKSGPDPLVHRKYLPFLQARSQANFRKEVWQLTWEQWLELWPDVLWEQRGRSSESLALTRIDNTQAWCMKNCRVITRKEQLGRDNRSRRGITYKTKPKEETDDSHS
jgi:hypothetical protein